jgi:N-succinyldiaminopimelate aminotransferase
VGKSFSFTGWKVGWCTGPAELVATVRAVKQFLTFAGGTPLQHGAAAALDAGESVLIGLREELRARRDQLCTGLAEAGLRPLRPAGTYFVNALVDGDAREFCHRLAQEAGIVAIPTGVFYDDQAAGAGLVRFAFCKRQEVIEQAVARLHDWKGGSNRP